MLIYLYLNVNLNINKLQKYLKNHFRFLDIPTLSPNKMTSIFILNPHSKPPEHLRIGHIDKENRVTVINYHSSTLAIS